MAREKTIDHYIKQMLGEMGVSGQSIDEIERMETYKSAEEEKKIKEMKKEKEEAKKEMRDERWWPHQAILRKMYYFFQFFGINIEYFSTYGKYEFSRDRIEKEYVKTDLTPTFLTITNWLKHAFNVPL